MPALLRESCGCGAELEVDPSTPLPVSQDLVKGFREAHAPCRWARSPMFPLGPIAEPDPCAGCSPHCGSTACPKRTVITATTTSTLPATASPPSKGRQCAGMTKKGEPCQAGATRGFDTCPHHRTENEKKRPDSNSTQTFEEITWCYGCSQQRTCKSTRLSDGTSAWMCAPCAQ